MLHNGYFAAAPPALVGAAALLTLVSLPVSAGPVTSTVTYKYYDFSGGTYLEMLRSILWYGPTIDNDQAFSTLSTRSNWMVRPASADSCHIKSLTFELKHVMTLPRHHNEKNLSPAFRKQVVAFRNNLKRHEEKHRAIQVSCFSGLRKHILVVRKVADCRAYSATIRRTVDKWAPTCSARHAAFDKSEDALTEKMPLVRQALQEINDPKAKAKTAGWLHGARLHARRAVDEVVADVNGRD